MVSSKEDPSKGAFVGCPAGWGCQLANANLFRAFEMEKKGWVLIDPGSAAGLDGTISKAADSEVLGLVTIGTQHQWLENIV
ncbi:MAG: hypothetical protein CM1200mP13_09990 [Candidatus Pelagibacterales bacterium]|nr:MAG: hypothetical protein CM1200mP13_09990 [Pelagibacterales bacterium]